MKARRQTKAGTKRAGRPAVAAHEPAVFEHADVILFCVVVEPTKAFRLVAVNRAFLKATGLKKSQVAGKLVEEVIPKTSLELVLKNYRHVVRTKKPVQWIARSIYAVGERHGEVSITPVLDARGRVTHLVGRVHDITARKQVEEALSISEERHARAVRGTHDGVWDWDIATGEDYLSPRWKELLGFQPDELVNHVNTFFSRIHPNDLARVKAAMQAHLKKRTPYDVEMRLRSKDGSYRWFRSRGEAERDARGKPVRMAGAITDISASKAIEQALRDSEERYRLLADHAEDFVTLFDARGNRLYLSPSYFRKTGWTLENLDRARWQTRVHPDDLEMVKKVRAENLKGKTTTIEYRILCRDGSSLWVEAHCKPIFDGKGKVWRMLGTSRDISGRKQAEEQFQREQRFSRALADHPSVLIMVLDAQGRIEHMNPVAAQGLGFRHEEILGRTPWELGLLDKHEATRSRKRFQMLLEGRAPTPVEVRLRAKSGEWRNVELRSTTTRNADGTMDRLIVVATDLTERLRLQQEVLRISEQEHARIGSDLHDGVGQTLTGVASLLDALEEELDGEKKRSAERIRLLLREAIQDVRRLSHGLSPAAVRHRELGGALQLLADTIRTNFRTDCVCRITGNIRISDAERQMHLFRIAQEAVNNALRHGKPKQIKLTLQHHGQDGGILKIENNGAGFPERHNGSDGIGLRVMDYRAGLIGGELQVQNRRGGGVCVICRFPAS
jgi:PAS domain S-box-containing protein